MSERLFNERLRLTLAKDEAFFAESVAPMRALRCVRMETLLAFSAHYAGQTAGQIGTGAPGAAIEIEGFRFEFLPGPNGWLHDSGTFKLSLMPTCSVPCAGAWLRAFKNALSHAPGFIEGASAHHFLGAEQAMPSLVALAKAGTVTWFNHPSGFLLATGLAETTKGSEHEICVERFIHHETCHLYEKEMEGWLRSLSLDVNRAYEAGSLNAVAGELNFQYLPDRMEQWRRDRTEKPGQTHFDEDMAAEFLVEAYAHSVIEQKPFAARGHWTPLDTVMDQMAQRRMEHVRRAASPPMRIMRLPRTIEVPASLAERSKLIAQGAGPIGSQRPSIGGH